MNGSELHFFVDATSVNVEGTTEDVWETDYVVDLIRIVGTTCRHQYVWATCHSILVANLRHRVCQSEDDRAWSHRANHVLREHVALRQTYEDVGTTNSLFESVDIATVGSEELLLRSELFAVGSDNALRVEHHDIFDLSAKSHIKLGARDSCSASTIYYDLDIGNILASHFESIL